MIAAIIQARMGSTRLPDKVMMDLAGSPVLWHVIDRLKHARRVDYILVATTQDPSDDIIEEKCRNWDIPVYRGPVDDVLARYYEAVCSLMATHGPVDAVVRITADCPLIDPQIVDKVIGDMLTGIFDYVSNIDPPTYPDGMDVEVFTLQALESAYRQATLASEREHVTPYIRNNPHFKKFNHTGDTNLSDIRLTLDTGKDFLVIEHIFQELYRPGEIFYLEDILQLLNSRPALREMNAMHKRNEGYQKSLKLDHTV
jgi:spore coat polysaccharide biosynthesis protein SpsF